jgi:hypothetical protein
MPGIETKTGEFSRNNIEEGRAMPKTREKPQETCPIKVTLLGMDAHRPGGCR